MRGLQEICRRVESELVACGYGLHNVLGSLPSVVDELYSFLWIIDECSEARLPIPLRKTAKRAGKRGVKTLLIRNNRKLRRSNLLQQRWEPAVRAPYQLYLQIGDIVIVNAAGV